MTVFRLVVAFVCSLILVERLSAQTNLQVPLQFDFLDPGARSLAMGGAFTPLADDATAAVTNPAGLTQLIAPEMSFEVRGRQLVTPYLRGGRLSGMPTGRGIDTVDGPIYTDAEDTRVFPSFVSLVYPARRVSVALYARQLVNVRQRFERVGVLGVFTTPASIVQDAREPPQRVYRRVDIGSGGISGGFRVTDRFAAGIGLSLSRMVIDETSTRYATEGIDLVSVEPVHPSVYGAPDFTRLASGGFSSRREVLAPQMRGDDWALSFNGGLLFNVRPSMRVAAAVHRGPRFTYRLILPDQSVTPGQFHTPDTYTLGIVSQPTDVLTIAAEYRRVNYSSLHRGFVDVIVGPNGEPEQFTVRDAHEWHAGVEFVFASARLTPAVRLGTWLDPSHEVGFTRSTAMNPYFNSLFSAALRGGEDLIHVTGGLGLSLSPRLELNIAADVTRGSRIVSASTILRF